MNVLYSGGVRAMFKRKKTTAKPRPTPLSDDEKAEIARKKSEAFARTKAAKLDFDSALQAFTDLEAFLEGRDVVK